MSYDPDLDPIIDAINETLENHNDALSNLTVATAALLGRIEALEADTHSHDGDPVPKPPATDAAAIVRQRFGTYPGAGQYADAGFNRMAALLGRDINYADANMGIATWGDATSSTWGLFEASWAAFRARPDVTCCITIGLQVKEGTRDLWEVADGQHDNTYRTILERMATYGHGDAILRIGHEPGVGYPWSLKAFDGNTVQRDYYIDAFRHVTELARSISPDFLIDYQGNGPWNKIPAGMDWDAPTGDWGYPGDEWVDIIGVDVYDKPTADTVARLEYNVDLARRHGKPWSIPEWGLWSEANGGNGDNPAFIQTIYDFCLANADDLAYHCYFDGISESRLDQYPNSAALLKELYS